MINFGIIGMGRMGMMHADWIIENKDLNLVAVCEKNPARIEELKNKYKTEVFTDFKDLLETPKIDFIVIATTNEFHEILTTTALENGKNVIVEKPMSLNYESTLRMIKSAEKNKRELLVFHSTRWDRDFLIVKEYIESGKLGKVLTVHLRVMLFGEYWAGGGIDGMQNPWRLKEEYGGGILMDWGPHLIDQLLILKSKDPISVYGILQSGLWCDKVDDHFFAAIKFDDNTICEVEASINCRIPLPRWYIIGTKGTLVINSHLTNVWDDVEISLEKEDGSKEIQNIKIVDHPGAGLSGGFYKDFIHYKDDEKDKYITMYQASKVVKILDMIKRSSLENKSILF